MTGDAATNKVSISWMSQIAVAKRKKMTHFGKNDGFNADFKREMNEMSYQSPIEIVHEQMQTDIENEILKTVMNVGVVVEKDELIKALAYDRNQYANGYNDRDSEIVRCKECIHYRYWGLTEDTVSECTIFHCENPDKDWFCADGER